MLQIISRSLLTDRSRTAISVLAVACAIALLMVLEGFKIGLWRQIGSYRQQLPVPLVLTQAGVENLTMGRSALTASVSEQVRTVPGVSETYPLVNVPLILSHADRKTPAYIVGYTRIGGPTQLKKGHPIEAPGEVVVDYALARKHSLALGQKLELLGTDFAVVGLSGQTSSMLGSYIFVTLDDALALFSARAGAQGEADGGTVSFILVDIVRDGDVSLVRKAIEESVPEVDVFTPTELASNDVEMTQSLMGSVLNLLVGAAYVVGILVIGLTLYVANFERLRDYGIMKAIGSTNARLYRHVFIQAIIMTVVSLALALLVSRGIAALLEWAAPQYLTAPWDPSVLLRATVAALAMSSVASLIPIRQVAGVDPAVVFKQ